MYVNGWCRKRESRHRITKQTKIRVTVEMEKIIITTHVHGHRDTQTRKGRYICTTVVQ